ncbi:MAG: cytidine deaminase [Dorea sp.]|mgnify:FL=1|nr:cytidine deaminase [Dorea sp.]
MERRDKTNYYLDLAEMVSQRCTCLRRHYGAVIVKNDEVISTGYVGAPRGRKNCTDLGECVRKKMGVPRGERYELCRSVHAEANAIISASRDKMIGSSMYLIGIEVDTGEYIKNANSCSMCKRLIINAGIKKVFIRDTKETYRMILVSDWVENDESIDGVFGY